MKNHYSFIIVSFSLIIIAACSRTSPPPTSQVTTTVVQEGVLGSADGDSVVEVTTTVQESVPDSSFPPLPRVTTTVVQEGIPGSADVNSMEMTTTTIVQEGVPGSITVNSVEMTAKVTAIDTVNRKLTLLPSEGAPKTVKAPPEVINLNHIKVGDLLKTTLTKEVIIHLDLEDAESTDEFATSTILAPKGAKPSGTVAGTVKFTATVIAIDSSQRTATLRLDDGTAETFPVREDIDLSKRKVGEKVVFIVTERVALSVEKP